MKQKIILICITLLSLLLVGCIDIYDVKGNRGTLVGIHFLDENKNNIQTNEFEEYSAECTLWKSKKHFQKVNAPAPREIYYVIDAIENQNYYLALEIEEKNGYTFSSITLYNEETKETIELSKDQMIQNKELPGEITEYYYLMENVTKEDYCYQVEKIMFSKQKTLREGSNQIAARTYVEGFGFNFNYDLSIDLCDIVIQDGIMIKGKEKLEDIRNTDPILIAYQNENDIQYVRILNGLWRYVEKQGDYYQYYDITHQETIYFTYYGHKEIDGIMYYYLSNQDINENTPKEDYKIIYSEKIDMQ